MTSRIKSKVVRRTVMDKSVLSMFNDVLGTGKDRADLVIAVPRFNELKKQLERYLTVVRLMQAIPALRSSRGRIADYEARVREAFDAELGIRPPREQSVAPVTGAPVSAALAFGEPDFDHVSEDEMKTFARAYFAAKEGKTCAAVLACAKALARHKNHLAEEAKLDDGFLMARTMATVDPFDIDIDLAMPYREAPRAADATAGGDRATILKALHKLYTISHGIYDLLRKPDVSAEVFSNLIKSALADAEKQIPGCGKAFEQIMNSTDLLTSKFDQYYHGYVMSNNPVSIMENFVLDVSNQSKDSPEVMGQLRKVINYYRKTVAAGSTDPKYKDFFKRVDENFSAFDDARDDPDGDDDSAPAAPAAPPAAPTKTDAQRAAARRKRAAYAAKKRAARTTAAPESKEEAVADDSDGDDLVVVGEADV